MAYDAAVLAKSDRSGRRAPALDRTLAKLVEFVSSPNIAETLDDELLKTIGYDTEREYKIDKTSRKDWEECAERAMDVALQVRKPKNYPFPGAANIKYPLVTVAALQFGARAYPAIIDGNRVVKAQVIGSDQGVPAMGPDGQPIVMQDPNTGEPVPQWQTPPGAKRERADRISEHMSYQLLCEMEEWEEDTDVLLHHIPIIGCAFRKVWRSEELGRNKAVMIPAVDLVVNQKVRNLDEAPRVTHVLRFYPQEIEEKQRAGIWLDVDLPKAHDAGEDDDAPQCFLEQHRYLDLDDDGYREPYIVTVHEESCQVVRIVANYRMEDVKYDQKRITRIPKSQYFVKYSFIPDPKGGFYDIGFGKLLESLSETIDTAINQMLDSGHLQTAGGGFIGSGIRLKKPVIKRTPGVWQQIELSGTIRDQVFPFPDQGPSAVLFNLLGMMIEAAKDITAVKDILTGDSGDKGVQTATTTLALIEQGLKVFTAIYKRIYRALKHEFKLLFLLNAQFLDEQQYFTVMDQEKAIARSDYDLSSIDIVPVADPKMVTDMQKSAKAQVLMGISEHPALGPLQNPRVALKRIYESVGMDNIDELMVPEQQGPSPAEQLMIADKTADIELKKAQATKAEAETAAKLVETQLKPVEVSHKIEQEARNAQADIEFKKAQATKAEADAAAKLVETQLKPVEAAHKMEHDARAARRDDMRMDQDERRMTGEFMQRDREMSGNEARAAEELDQARQKLEQDKKRLNKPGRGDD
jgi:chaperonin GroES